MTQYVPKLTARQLVRDQNTLLPLSLLFSVLSFVAAGCSPHATRLQQERTSFSRIVEEVLREPRTERVQEGPFSWLTERGEDARRARAREHLRTLLRVDTASLTVDDRIDWRVLVAQQRRVLADSVLLLPQRDPSRYITLGSISWDVGDGTHLGGDGWRRVKRTLEECPVSLEIGRRRLSSPPPLWVHLAVNTLHRHEAYLSDVLPDLVRRHTQGVLRDSLDRALDLCLAAVRSYRTMLADDLRAGEEGSWAVGADYYDWLLKEYHMLPFTAEVLIEEGRRVHAETRRALEELAQTRGNGRTWRQMVEEMKNIHPPAYGVMKEYEEESRRALRLLVDRSMIEIPPAETLLFVPTPPALRETYAWGGYGGVVMRDSVMTGRFFVTDVVPEMDSLQAEQKLRTQNTGWLTPIALHEGYPGHHLQTVYARLHPNTVRSRYGSTYFGEGWALYCESWMGRNGFYTDTWDSLGWLNMRLWRTARVIVDPSIHTGKMTYEEAVSFMVEEVGLERSAAEAEVNRYTTWPTQAPSYIIGWLELERIKEDLRRAYGTSVTDRVFAERVLRTGSLPLALMREALWDSFGRNPGATGTGMKD